MFRLSVACVLAHLAVPVAAQDSDTPLSAIDWLSQSVVTPPQARPVAQGSGETPVATSGAAPNVTTSALDAPSADSVGLLPPEVTGLPRSLWSSSQTDVLVALIQATDVETLPALQDLMMTLMLAEADAPVGAMPDAPLFLARIDKLLDIGALDPAQAMLEMAGPDTPVLYRRWFDISLLTGTEDAACATQRDQPHLATTFPARIFCLARNGDWPAAALTLGTARALGDITPEEERLLTHFLDPELFEGEADLAPPTRPSPLVYRMREAIGQSLPTASLPRAFAHADLRDTIAWRYQMQAAERLVRTGAVPDGVLLGFYTEHRPAASGGVWDRADAVQEFEAALRQGDAEKIAGTLPVAWAVMQDIRAEVAFARLFAADLLAMDLAGETARLSYQIGLLSTDYARYARQMAPISGQERLWQQIALGEVPGQAGATRAQDAVVAAFAGAVPPAALTERIAAGQIGEALLRTIALFEQGMSGDMDAVTDALATLRALGLHDTARQVALQFLILERRS